MTCTWEIVVPEATTNLVTNPSFETGTAGWTKAGNLESFTRITTSRHSGLACARLYETSTGGSGEYIISSQFAASPSVYYTCSAYIKKVIGAAGGRLYLWFYTSAPAYISGVSVNFASGTFDWTRYEVSGQAPATTAYVAALIALDGSGAGQEFEIHADCIQIEQKSYSTTYCDGDQPGCTWSGTAHGSTSSRSAQYRGGGRIYQLDTLTDPDISIGQVTGAGMPPMPHIVDSQPLIPGSLFRGRNIQPVPLQFNLFGGAGNTNDLHNLRDDLINVIKPDKTKDDDPFQLRYTESTNPENTVYCMAVYDSGLELGPSRGTTEIIPLRLIAYDPAWYELGNDAKVVSTYTATLADCDYIVQYTRNTATWSACDGGTNGTVYAIEGDNITPPSGSSSDGCYIGGAFTTAGGTTVNRVAYYDATADSFVALGSGTVGVDGTVYALHFDYANGLLYVGGDFANAGGGAAANIATYNPSTDAWAAVGTGPDDVVRAITQIASDYIVVGGDFTNAGGAAAAYLAVWNSSTTSWSQAGSGMNAAVLALDTWVGSGLITTHNGWVVIVGGSFTTADGVATNYVCEYNPVTAAFGVFTGEPNGAVRDFSDQSYLGWYIVGDFTTVAGTTTNYIARRSGTTFIPEGAGFDDICRAVIYHYYSYNNVFGGDFTTAGGNDMTNPLTKIYAGTNTFTDYEIDLPGSPTVYALGQNGYKM